MNILPPKIMALSHLEITNTSLGALLRRMVHLTTAVASMVMLNVVITITFISPLCRLHRIDSSNVQAKILALAIPSSCPLIKLNLQALRYRGTIHSHPDNLGLAIQEDSMAHTDRVNLLKIDSYINLEAIQQEELLLST